LAQYLRKLSATGRCIPFTRNEIAAEQDAFPRKGRL
jgi:hypothetical protein